jgi:pimeloyl-ACP methyl ester carboxylesterase
MQRSSPVDGFSIAYEQSGNAPSVLLLHGWPGDRTDFRSLVPLLAPAADVLWLDLRGFGESDKHAAGADQYSADAQARSVVGLVE